MNNIVIKIEGASRRRTVWQPLCPALKHTLLQTCNYPERNVRGNVCGDFIWVGEFLGVLSEKKLTQTESTAFDRLYY